MEYDTTFLAKISSFGVLGYSPEKIIDLVDPEDPAQFQKDVETPGTEAYKAYHKGSTTGEYTMDKVLFDLATKDRNSEATIQINQRLQTKKINDKIREKFGL